MDEQQTTRRQAATVGQPRAASRSRSRSREHEGSQPPIRQLRSTTQAAAAVQAACGNNPQSMSRLHDDELSCVLPFLSLTDLARLVRRSRRLNGVARKERRRGLLRTSLASTVPYLLSSSLGHHVTSLRLSDRAVALKTLRHRRSLPQLTALQFELSTFTTSIPLIRKLTSDTAVATLQAALPTRLRIFEFLVRALDVQASTWALQSVLAALPAVMTQLTELNLDVNISGGDMWTYASMVSCSCRICEN
jgi:hypothetical protein